MNSKHIQKIIDKQFLIAGHKVRYKDIVNNKVGEWWIEYTCTEEQNEKWKKWVANYLKKNLKFTKDRATVETAWIDLNYGLRISDFSNLKNKKK